MSQPRSLLVDVESSSSVSTSVDRPTNRSSGTSSSSSDDSLSTRQRQCPQTVLEMNDGIFRVPTVQTLTSGVVEDSTVLTQVPINLATARALQGEDSDFESLEDLPTTKRQLPRDFALKTNTISLEYSMLSLEIDRSRFKPFVVKSGGLMADAYIHIPFDHFTSGPALPLDPAFCDFLNLVKCQPVHVTPTVLIFLCFNCPV